MRPTLSECEGCKLLTDIVICRKALRPSKIIMKQNNSSLDKCNLVFFDGLPIVYIYQTCHNLLPSLFWIDHQLTCCPSSCQCWFKHPPLQLLILVGMASVASSWRYQAMGRPQNIRTSYLVTIQSMQLIGQEDPCSSMSPLKMHSCSTSHPGLVLSPCSE